MAASLLVPVVLCSETNLPQPAAAVGCQNFSGKMAALVLLLWRKCHLLRCIRPPGVSSLSLTTGYFLWHYCCLQSLLFVIDILTVLVFAFFLQKGDSSLYPRLCFLLLSPHLIFFPMYLLVAVTLTWVPNRCSRAGTLVFRFLLTKMSASNKPCYIGTSLLFNSTKYGSELASIPVYSLMYFLLAFRGWR